MTEKNTSYEAGKVEPYYWIECRVMLPAERDSTTGEPQEFSCQARVQQADVVDALELDRWTTQAFQYIWRAGKKPGESKKKELSKAAWFLQRGVELDGHWQAALCDVVAAAIERGVDRHGSRTLGLGLMEFVGALRSREPEAVAFVAEAYGDSLTKAEKTAPAVGTEP
jgi:hypothetical protein